MKKMKDIIAPRAKETRLLVSLKYWNHILSWKFYHVMIGFSIKKSENRNRRRAKKERSVEIMSEKDVIEVTVSILVSILTALFVVKFMR